MSPSSFIPFCQIGDRVLGVKRDDFPIPVCNIFRPKIFNDQLCYEIDAEFVEDAMIKEGNLEIALFIDINEDRQFSWISKDVLKRNQGKLYLFSIYKYTKILWSWNGGKYQYWRHPLTNQITGKSVLTNEVRLPVFSPKSCILKDISLTRYFLQQIINM